MMELGESTCPVPKEQQPINEYEQLKESWFFGWTAQGWLIYARKLAWVWGISWLVTGPISAASFPPGKYPVQFFLCGAGGAMFFVVLVLLRLYLGWKYVSDRLESPTITYEESGWYDGQSCPKTSEILTRDRLIVSYQIKPIVRRLQQSFGAIALGVIVIAFIWYLL